MESRTRKSARNASFAFFTRIITLILGFVSRKIFLSFLTTEYLGINGLFANVLTMLSLAELGIGNVIQFSLYKPLKQGDHEHVKVLMQFYKKAYLCIGAAVMLIGICLLPFMDLIVTEKPNITENLSVIYLLFVLNSAVSYLFSYNQTLLHADQNGYVVTMYNSISAIFLNVLHIIVLALTHSYFVYLISNIVCTTATNIFISFAARKRYPYLKDRQYGKLDERERKRIFSDAKALSISKVAGVACNGTDNIIITRVLGLVSVGLASNYTLIINSLSGMMYAILSGTTGSIGNLNVDASKEQKTSMFNQLMMVSYLIYGTIFACVIALINSFISEVWLGAEYVVSLHTIISLVLIAFQSGMNFTAYTFRTTLGYFDQVKYVYVATAVLNIGLSILMGRLMGLPGIFYATTISKLVTSEIADGYYSYKYGLGKGVGGYFVKYAGYFLLFAVCSGVCSFVANLIPIHGIVGFLVKGVVCVALSIFINVAVLCRQDAFKQLIKKFSGLLPARWRKRK